MQVDIYRSFKRHPQKPGKYLIGFERLDAYEQQRLGPHYIEKDCFYDGSDWTDGNGRRIVKIRDPILKVDVPVREADFYVPVPQKDALSQSLNEAAHA